MEKETSSLVSLGIVLIAIAVVITLGFGIFAVGKRLANSGQNDLVSQVDQISTSTFTDLDQQVITGTRLKGVINQLSSGNYAVLLNTLAMRNSYIDGTKVTGDLADGIANYAQCMVNTNVPGASSRDLTDPAGDHRSSNTWFVNYNALLGDAANSSTLSYENTCTITDGSSVPDGGSLEAFLPTVDTAPGSDTALQMKDGVLTTEQEFQTNEIGNVAKNIRQSDFNKQGTTMYIADAAQFNCYCIKDSTDNYVGMAFMQIQK